MQKYDSTPRDISRVYQGLDNDSALNLTLLMSGIASKNGYDVKTALDFYEARFGLLEACHD